MKFVILLVFINFEVVFSLSGQQQYLAVENVYGTDIVSDEITSEIGHRIFKKSITAPTNSKMEVNPEGTAQEPCRLTLPTLDLFTEEISQDPYSDDGGQDYQLMGLMPPRMPSYPHNIPFNKWTPYDLDSISHEPPQDYRVSYNSYNMPFIYSNPVPSVRSLPPVISTHIHETIPEISEINNGYEMDGFPDNEMYFPPYVRAVRSRDEDFLDQLAKDAVIPNILPTMPFPYMRTAGLPNYQAQYHPSYQSSHQGGPVALFPAGSSSACALPFLLSCTPKISYGTLTNAHGGNPVHSPLATNRKYDVGTTHTIAH